VKEKANLVETNKEVCKCADVNQIEQQKELSLWRQNLMNSLKK